MSQPVVKQMPRMLRNEMNRVNRGLYLDRSTLAIPDGGWSGCHNVRLRDGKVRADNMGWEKFFTTQLTGHPLLIDNFFTRAGAQTLIIATPLDLYRHVDDGEPLFITPIYSTGTVSITGPSTTVTGVGTLWDTGTPKNAKAGDFIAFDANDEDDPAAEWLEIDSITNDTSLELVSSYAGTKAGVAYTIRKVFTGDESDIWDADVFPYSQTPADLNEDIWYATNGFEMVKWNGNDATVEIYDPGFVCRVIRYHKNMMLYGYIEESGQVRSGSVRNSAIGFPENVSTDDASEWVATDGVDPIYEIAPLGDIVVVYCEKSINLAQFVGYPVVFAIRTAVPDTGAISGRAVMNIGDFHEFVGDDRAYRFDGVTLSEMGPQVFREVLRTIDPSRREKVLSYRDRENGEIHYVVPKTTDAEDAEAFSRAPEIAYTAHYQEPRSARDPVPFSVRDLPATAMGFFQRSDTLRFDDPEMDVPFSSVDFRWNDRFFEALFPFHLFGDKNGYVYKLGTIGSQDGAAISSWVRFPRKALGDGNRKGVVKRIEPFAERRGSATYFLGVITWTTDFAEGDLTKASQLDYDLKQEGTRYVSPRVVGRYGEVEFASVSSDHGWEISGYAISVVPGGER